MVGDKWVVTEAPSKAKRARASQSQTGQSSPLNSQTPRSRKQSPPGSKLSTPDETMEPPSLDFDRSLRQANGRTPISQHDHQWTGNGHGHVSRGDKGQRQSNGLPHEEAGHQRDEHEQFQDSDFLPESTYCKLENGANAELAALVEQTPISPSESIWRDVGEDIRQTLSPVGQMEVEAMSNETRQVRGRCRLICRPGLSVIQIWAGLVAWLEISI